MTTSDRLLAIIDLFSMEEPTWSVEEAAATLGLSTSTAYRYFNSLTGSGLLTPLGPKHYVLGPTFIRYDRILRLTDPLVGAARRHMDRLAQLMPGRTVVFLCRLFGEDVMSVHQCAVGTPAFGVSYERGRLMPLYRGSASKVILAHVGPRMLRRLYAQDAARFADARLGSDLEAVRAALRRIRAKGCSITSGEVVRGMRGISAPLFGAGEAICGSLTVAAPRTVLAGAATEEISSALRETGPLIDADLRRAIMQRNSG